MNLFRLLALLAALLAMPASLTFASSNDVLVVFNGATQVNRETYNFIRQNLSRAGLSYTVSATTDPTTVKSTDYKAVVVVNSSVASGTDPVLAKFLAGFSAKKLVYLVNLYSGMSSLKVTTFTAATNAAGVDGVTAASTWHGAMQVHTEWMGDLVTFLKKA